MYAVVTVLFPTNTSSFENLSNNSSTVIINNCCNKPLNFWFAEAALHRCSYKTVFWKYIPNLQSDFKVLESNFIGITLRDGCSPVNLLHILRTHFPENTSGGLLLNLVIHFIMFNFCGGGFIPTSFWVTIRWLNTLSHFMQLMKYPYIWCDVYFTCAYQGVRSVSFSENFAYVLNAWSQCSLSQSRLNAFFIAAALLKSKKKWYRNHLIVNPTKWSITLKQFVGYC